MGPLDETIEDDATVNGNDKTSGDVDIVQLLDKLKLQFRFIA